MKKERFVLAFFTGCLISAVSLQAQTSKDSTKVARSYAINEVVVTGTRSETDVRHLPMTVSVVGRPQLEASQQTSVLPVLNSQVPGFFSTSRGVMGYGVATGCIRANVFKRHWRARTGRSSHYRIIGFD